MRLEKTIVWMGSAYDDLLRFPAIVRRDPGHQLSKVQAGLDPDDWKPFNDIGKGTREIRLRGTDGSFRLLYVAKFAGAIYVLHCFQKKTPATSTHDKTIATLRYRAIKALTE